MRFKAEDGSEWEAIRYDKFAHDGIKCILRIPVEKSELEKWISERGDSTICGGAYSAGFGKAIDVLKAIECRKASEYPYIMYTLVDLIAELKNYAGIK